jgi:hypothetical protein
MRISKYEQLWEVFVFPTIKIIYDKHLLGYYSIDFIWLRWGFSVSWGHKK